MKTMMLSLGLMFAAATVLATNQTQSNQDKPWRIYLVGDYQNQQDDTVIKQWFYFQDGTFWFRTELKQWNHYDHDWAAGLGGNGLYRYGTFNQQWDASENQSFGLDDDLIWPFGIDWTGDGLGDAITYNHGDAVATNTWGMSVWAAIGNEHCDVEDAFPSPTSWDNASWYGWSHEEGEETYTRKADTVWHVQTGGKAIPGRKNLWQFTGSAWEVLDKRAVPRFGGASMREITNKTQIVLKDLGALKADGNLWLTLPDDVDKDITPCVAGNDFFTFSVGGQKYKLVHETFHQALTDTNWDRTSLGVGEEVYVGFEPPVPLSAPDINWACWGGSLEAASWGNIMNNYAPAAGMKFTAPSNAAASMVIVAVRGGAFLPVPFSVYEPSGVFFEKQNPYPNSNIDKHKKGFTSAGFFAGIQIQPTSVSFYRILVKEDTVSPTSGSGVWPNEVGNHQEGSWFPVYYNNSVFARDRVGSSLLGVVPGGYTWLIPFRYQVGYDANNGGKVFCTLHHVFSADSSGTATQSKESASTAPIPINADDTGWIR